MYTRYPHHADIFFLVSFLFALNNWRGMIIQRPGGDVSFARRLGLYRFCCHGMKLSAGVQTCRNTCLHLNDSGNLGITASGP